MFFFSAQLVEFDGITGGIIRSIELKSWMVVYIEGNEIMIE